MTMTPTACGKVVSPDSSGERPRSVWRRSGIRKSTPNRPPKERNCTAMLLAKSRSLKSRRSIIGLAGLALLAGFVADHARVAEAVAAGLGQGVDDAGEAAGG